jgi:hypothetical protein
LIYWSVFLTNLTSTVGLSPVLPPLSVTTQRHVDSKVPLLGMDRDQVAALPPPPTTDVAVSPETYCHE